MLVDGDAILCFESSVTIDVEWVGNWKTVCCSGEGLFNTKMTGKSVLIMAHRSLAFLRILTVLLIFFFLFKGPGKVWLQSMGIDKMRKLFPPRVVQKSSTSDGDGGDDGGE